MSNQPCSHPTTIVAKTSGKYSDEDVRTHICLTCGFPVLVAPVSKFKSNAEAIKFFKKIQSEIELPHL